MTNKLFILMPIVLAACNDVPPSQSVTYPIQTNINPTQTAPNVQSNPILASPNVQASPSQSTIPLPVPTPTECPLINPYISDSIGVWKGTIYHDENVTIIGSFTTSALSFPDSNIYLKGVSLTLEYYSYGSYSRGVVTVGGMNYSTDITAPPIFNISTTTPSLISNWGVCEGASLTVEAAFQGLWPKDYPYTPKIPNAVIFEAAKI